MGLSPRGRGKTNAPGRPRFPTWVYPRVGGENGIHVRKYSYRNGLSPRGRGKRFQHGSPLDSRRSIPAWAGETRGGRLRLRRTRVYPRVGGGTLGQRTYNGLSPCETGQVDRVYYNRKSQFVGLLPKLLTICCSACILIAATAGLHPGSGKDPLQSGSTESRRYPMEIVSHSTESASNSPCDLCLRKASGVCDRCGCLICDRCGHPTTPKIKGFRVCNPWCL